MNLSDWRCDSALTVAAKNGATDLIKLILDAGGNITHQDNQGYDALASAASGGHISTLKELVHCGGDKKTLTSAGRTLVHVAAGMGKVRLMFLNAMEDSR